MKLENKQKKGLLVLAIILTLLLTYLYVVAPFLEKIEILKAEAISLEQEEKRLIDINTNKDFYIEETNIMIESTATIFALYPTEIQQESSIMFFNDIENIRFTKLPSTSFSELEEIPLVTIVSETETATEVDTSAETDTSETDTSETDTSTQTEASTELSQEDTLMGLKTVTQFSYKAEYEDFKRFLNYIKENGHRMVITDITLAYEEEMVSGGFTIVEYGISGGGRPPEPDVQTGSQVGVANIFKVGDSIDRSAAFTAEDTIEEEGGYDAFALLNQPEANIAPVIVGLPNDAQGESYLEAGGNLTHEIDITMSGIDGWYYIRYSINGEEPPVTLFEVGDNLDFRIISSNRFSEGDNVSANLSFNNKTDKELTVTIVNDDSENPRVYIDDIKGAVIVQ